MKDELKVLKSKYTFYKKSFEEDLKILPTIETNEEETILHISTLRVYLNNSLAIAKQTLLTIKNLQNLEKNKVLTRKYFDSQKENIDRNQKTLDEKFEEVKDLISKYIDVNKKVVE